MTLQQGDTAEDFELLAHDGKPITLSFIQKLKKCRIVFLPKKPPLCVSFKKSLRDGKKRNLGLS